MSSQERIETALYTMEYDAEIDAVVFTWEEFASGNQFRDGANDLLEFIREQNAEKLLVNMRGIKAHDEEDQEWLTEEWVPKIIDAGIEYSVNVHRDSVVSEMDTENLYRDLEDLEYESLMTDDVEEAREWLAGQ